MHSSVNLDADSFGNSKSLLQILSAVPLLLFAENGISPNKITNRITPIDQMSIAGVNYFSFPCRTSGAIYLKLPASRLSILILDATPAIPKSITY